MPRAFSPVLQELSLDCRPGLAFTPGAFALLGRGGLRSLTLICDSIGADTPHHLGCLTGLTQLQMFGSRFEPLEAEGCAALRHLTVLSGLTQLVHLHVELGRGAGEGLPPAFELLALLAGALLEKVGRPGHHLGCVLRTVPYSHCALSPLCRWYSSLRPSPAPVRPVRCPHRTVLHAASRATPTRSSPRPPAPLLLHAIAQVSLCPCRLDTPEDADIAPALAQLSHVTSLELGMFATSVHFSATRAGGGWRVDCQQPLQPGVAAALARSFSGAAAPAGRQEQRQQPAAEVAAGHTSKFNVFICMPHGPSSQQALELTSLGRVLAAFDDVDVGLWWMDQACQAAAHALLQPVAARLVSLGHSGASPVYPALGALQRLVLPRLAELRLQSHGDWIPSAVTAVIGLEAPRLAIVTLTGIFDGSTAAVMAAVTALAVGRPQPVGPDGRPAGLTLVVGKAVLSDEELGEVRTAVAAARRPGCVTLGRP
jgi:hypothetical protein